MDLIEYLPQLWMREVDRYIADEIYKDRVYADILPPNLRRPAILDLGGNIGCAARWFLSEHPGARVYSVEPDADNFAILETNIAGTSAGAICAGVHWRRAQLILTSPAVDSRPCAYRSSEVAVGTILGLPIEDIITLAGFLGPIALLKVDIEGAEDDLFLSGGLDWLGAVERIVCEVHNNYGPQLICRVLQRNGFQTEYRDATRLIVAARP